MPPIQTSYSEQMQPYALGRRVNMEEWNGLTGLAEDVEANPIGFGQPVMDGTDGEQVKLWDGTGVFRGITEADETLGANTYPEGANVPVCESGVIAVMAGGACTKRTPVYWIAASGTYTSTSADGTLVPNAEFDATVASGSLVPVRLRRIPPAA